MRHELRERPAPVLVLAACLAATPAAVELVIGDNPAQFTGRTHVYAVGFTAFAAALASVALSIAGARRRDGRTVLVAAGFAVMAGLLALHGLSTPGVLVGQNGVIAITGGLTLPVGGLVLLLATFAPANLLRRVDLLLLLEAGAVLALLALGVLALADPAVVPSVPSPNDPAALALLGLGVAVFAVLALRALRTYLLTRRSSDIAVGVGLIWLLTAVVPALTMTYTQLGWWIGHEIELNGILVVGTIVAVDLARATQSRPLAGDLRAAELVRSEELFLGSNVRALTRCLAEKDAYTERHARRVALLAVQCGELLGLSTRRLRALAIGGLVHDMGKLSVPDSILKKPGPLDDDEYAIVQRHPEAGARLLQELGGFPTAVRRLVREHHERLDGTGYPRGLRADGIDLETRILAVCDVYDALISPRVYRPAWTHERAVDLLRRESGTAFDPRCVAALEQALVKRLAESGPTVDDRAGHGLASVDLSHAAKGSPA
jgi:hypothetical protein